MTKPPRRPGGGSAPLETVRVEEAHAAALAEFIRVIWNPQATAESVLASRAVEAEHNVAEPGVPPPTWITLQSGKVLGYVTTIPIRLWDGGRDWPAYWIKGLMVHPDFRNGPIGYFVLKAAIAQLPRTGALAVAPPARRLFEALGYTDLGAIQNWIRPLAPHRILRRLDLAALGLAGPPGLAGTALTVARRTGLATLLGWAGGAALRGSAAALRLGAARLNTERFTTTPAADEIELLWKTVSSAFPSGVVRDSRYLLHRYPAGTESPYLWIGARRGGVLVGVAILRRPRPDGDPRLQGVRVATLADVLHSPREPAVGLALLGAVERLARTTGADAVLATCPTPALQTLLRRQWYLPIAGNVHFLLRDVTSERSRFGGALQEWWLTRGDGSADEVF